MSKIFAVFFVLILCGAIFYIYNLNTSNVGVQIDKLKVKYTIGYDASPEKILLFSEDLSNLSKTKTDLDKKRLEFESKLWSGIGYGKEISTLFIEKKNLTDNCDDLIKDAKQKIVLGKENIESAKKEFLIVKDLYNNVEQEEITAKIDNVIYSLAISEDLAYINCP